MKGLVISKAEYKASPRAREAWVSDAGITGRYPQASALLTRGANLSAALVRTHKGWVHEAELE